MSIAGLKHADNCERDGNGNAAPLGPGAAQALFASLWGMRSTEETAALGQKLPGFATGWSHSGN